MTIKLEKLSELLARPIVPVDWLWERRLVGGLPAYRCQAKGRQNYTGT